MFDFILLLILIFISSLAGLLFGLYDTIKNISQNIPINIGKYNILKITFKICFSKNVWLIFNLPDSKKEFIEFVISEINKIN